MQYVTSDEREEGEGLGMRAVNLRPKTQIIPFESISPSTAQYLPIYLE
jgi:hypothetical protein